MINKKLDCYNSLFLLIIFWVLFFSVRRAYIAPIFDHEAHCFIYGGYFYEANGWLFILLAQCLKRWFGASLFVVRILPILANLGICCLLYRIAEYIYNKKIALLALLLYAINPMVYFFASFARFYTFGVFFVLLACYLTFKACESGSLSFWYGAAIAYLCAFNSWILTSVLMISIWFFMLLFMKLDRKDRNKILQIAMLVSLNFILLIIFDVRGIKRISTGTDFSVYQLMFDVYGMSGMSWICNTITEYIFHTLGFYKRITVDLGMLALFLIYSIFSFICTFKSDWAKNRHSASFIFSMVYSVLRFIFSYKGSRSKYSFFPSFVFLTSVVILVVFSIFKTSVFNSKNIFLLLPLWILMFSVLAVKFRVFILFIIASFCGMADYLSSEGYAPEHQIRTFVDHSYYVYLSNNNIVDILKSRNIKIDDNVYYEPDAIESLYILQSALNSKKACLLLTDIREEKMMHLINRDNPGLRVFVYGEDVCANIRAYFIVPPFK